MHTIIWHYYWGKKRFVLRIEYTKEIFKNVKISINLVRKKNFFRKNLSFQSVIALTDSEKK